MTPTRRNPEIAAAIVGVVGVIEQLSLTVSALVHALLESRALPDGAIARHTDQAAMEKSREKVQAAIKRLREGSPLEDILKSYEGPIQ